MYKVRVIVDDPQKSEIIKECASKQEAFSLFLFYVGAALELNCSIWCVNVLNGRKSIKLFTNH